MRAQRNSKKCRQYSVLLAAEIAQKQKIKTKTSMFNAMVRVYTCVPSSEESVSQNTVYWKMVLPRYTYVSLIEFKILNLELKSVEF